MIKRLNDLSIGQMIFVISIAIVGIILMLATITTNQLIFTRTDKLIETTSKEINKQVIMNYENYLSNVIDISNSLQGYIVDYTKDEKVGDLNRLFIATTNIEKNIRSVALLDQNGIVIASSINDPINPRIADIDWFKQAIGMADIHHFSGLHTENIILNGTDEVVTISKYVQYISQNKTMNGVLMIDINTSNFKTLASQTNLGVAGHIIITDQNNGLIYSSDNECTSRVCESAIIAQNIVLGGKLVNLNALNMYVNVNTIKDTRWKIATFINVDDIVTMKREILIQMIFIFLGTLIAVAITSLYFARRITNPMNKLKKHISLIEQGDFESRVYVEGQKEVILLADAFNNMSDKVKELMEKVLNEQNEKRKTHFIALQNQINPHFLYNTLDSIVALSENNRNKDVELAIIALSKFFRMSISSEMNLVELKDEIEHIRNYLVIQQIRYRNAFKFDFDIDEEILHHKVIKLSLQPLVENAILHGIQPDESFTTILIKAYFKDGFTYIEVFNEGYGISADRIQEIHDMMQSDKQSSSLGLKNVYQRLKLYYGDAANLSLESELDEYTKVIMKMPFSTEGEL